MENKNKHHLTGFFLILCIFLSGCKTSVAPETGSVVVPTGSCDLDGVTVSNGTTVIAHLEETVANIADCTSQPRTCTNGSLSGTYPFSSCSEAPITNRSCTFNGVTVAHGSSVPAFQSASVPAGTLCSAVSQNRSCTNGTLSGTYQNSSCVVNCALAGLPVAHGTSVVAFQNSTPPIGSSCSSISQSRNCTNGTLSGSFTHSLCDDPVAPPTGVLVQPPQSAINEALKMGNVRYYRKSNGEKISNAAHWGSSAVTLALASYTGNTSADSAVLAQVRTSIVGGNEPFFAGGYYAQHERHLTGTLALLKKTPRLWQQLSQSEIQKIDLMMKASLIGSAFTTSDNSQYIKANQTQRALDGDTNLNRGWNPNYREGMIGGVLVAMVYFGGPAQTDAILNSYNHNNFVAELDAHDLTNIYDTFTTRARDSSSNAPSGSTIEASVKNYRYMNSALSNYKKIYLDLTRNTYSKKVNCGLNNGAGIGGAGALITGCDTLPNKNTDQGGPARGMLTEFDSSDANGKRSAVVYTYDGYRISQTNQLVLIAGGYLNVFDPDIKQLVKEMNVGVVDLTYKLQKGYHDYHKGQARGIKRMTDMEPDFGYRYTLPIWNDVLKKYHGL